MYDRSSKEHAGADSTTGQVKERRTMQCTPNKNQDKEQAQVK